MAARSGQIKALLGDEFALEYIAATGDCFYDAVSKALSSSSSSANHQAHDQEQSTAHTPATLRSLVASSLTDESLHLFRTAHQAGCGGFEFMRKTNDLESLRQRHLISGRDAGAGQCIWANDYAISTIATELNVCVHIMDEESGRARTPRTSTPSAGGRKRRRTAVQEGPPRSSGTFVTIRPEATSACARADTDTGSNGKGNSQCSSSLRHIFLQRTRRQHFNLIVERAGEGKEERSVGIFDTVPTRLRKYWTAT